MKNELQGSSAGGPAFDDKFDNLDGSNHEENAQTWADVASDLYSQNSSQLLTTDAPDEKEKVLFQKEERLLEGSHQRIKDTFGGETQYSVQDFFSELRLCDTRNQSPQLTGKPIDNTCALELSDLYERAQPGVVKISSSAGEGTGFLACTDEACEIVTSKDLVGEDKTVKVEWNSEPNKREVRNLPILNTDSRSHLALVEINEADLPGMKPLGLDTKPTRHGDPLFSIGHTYGRDEQFVAPGTVRLITDDCRGRGKAEPAPDIYLSSMQYHPGDEGGPVLSKRGLVAGVTLGSERGLFGPLSVAMPAKEIVDLIDRSN